MRASCSWFAVFVALGCSTHSASTTPTVSTVPAVDAAPVAPSSDPPTVTPDAGAPVDDLGGARDLAVPPDDLAVPPDDLASAPRDLAEPWRDLAQPPSPDLATNPAGPWPVADLTFYPLSNLIDASPDEAQNVWAVSYDSLWLLRPGSTDWKRYTAADGLHIVPFTDPDGHPNVTHITAMAGGGTNQVFVGYYGYESDATRDTDSDALSSLGWADRVNLVADGTLNVVHYWFHCDRSPGIVEDRSTRRMIYAHDGNARGHLFLGMDHGVVHIFDDLAGDHVHPEVWYQRDAAYPVEKIGENFGLSVTPSGDLWIAGGYGVGLQAWNPTPHLAWVDAPFKEAFTVYTGDHELNVPYGYREDQRGVAVTPDGRVWFASFTHGLWDWDATSPHSYSNVHEWSSVPSQLTDLAADLDGTLWIVTYGGQLLRFNPATNSYVTWPGISDARRIVMDTTVVPRALYVSMGGGLAVIRAK
jgi:hypothetical protein